jgi:hypothetical protein
MTQVKAQVSMPHPIQKGTNKNPQSKEDTGGVPIPSTAIRYKEAPVGASENNCFRFLASGNGRGICLDVQKKHMITDQCYSEFTTIEFTVQVFMPLTRKKSRTPSIPHHKVLHYQKLWSAE